METLEVGYDPDIIAYEDLIDLFLASISSGSIPHKRQYARAIFPTTEAQELVARRKLEGIDGTHASASGVELIPGAKFHSAEMYHQKFYLQGVQAIFAELRRTFPDPWALIDSHVAARLNGYLGGFGDIEEFEAEVDDLVLTPKAKNTLQRIVRSRT